MMTDAAEVKTLVKALNAAATGSGTAEEVIVILKRLQVEVVATEQLLKETKVGVAVSKLRNHASKDVSDLSKVIVKKWKGEVHHPDKPKTKSSTPTTGGAKSAPTSVKKEKAESSASASPAPLQASKSLSSTPAEPSPHTSVSSQPVRPPGPRSSKSDGIKIPTLGDKVRDKCLEMVYDALASDSSAPAEQILTKARAVENGVYGEFGDINANYRNKMRRLFLNLKDKSNPRLRDSVVSGDLPVARFCVMTVQEMASEERRQADKALDEMNLHNSLGAGEQEAETDAFQCSRCKERKTRYRQAQTRSADEPMTTFVTCVNCGNRWKFS